MRIQHHTPAPTLAAAFLLAAACGGAPAERRSAPGPAPHEIIHAEAIALSGAKSAWDAVRLTVRSVAVRETRGGRPAPVLHRGQSSIYLADQVQIFVDRLRIYELQTLDDMPASDVVRIEVLSGIDATTLYGTNAADGVILIFTHLIDEAEG